MGGSEERYFETPEVTDLIISSFADEQISDAAVYFESRQAGLGHRFLEDIDNLIERITEHLNSGRESRNGHRVGLTSIFSYKLVYRVEVNAIYIHRIWHSSRDVNI